MVGPNYACRTGSCEASRRHFTTERVYAGSCATEQKWRSEKLKALCGLRNVSTKMYARIRLAEVRVFNLVTPER